MSKCVISLPY